MFLSISRLTLLFTIIIFFIVVFLLFTFNGITRSKSVEVELEPLAVIQLQSKHQPKLHPLADNYKNKIFNLTLKYITNANSCNNEELLAVIIVTSYYGNVETRSAIRRAYSQQQLQELGLKRVFLLGEAPNDRYMSQNAIYDENRRFKDIIQGNFIEAYRNLTYKHIMGLKWISDNCNTAKYVVKMDDDIVVNIEKTVKLLVNIALPSNSIAGYVLRNMVPIREPANKWFVTKEEYPHSKYPSFVSGWFYITTPTIASKFSLLSHYYQYFWIDDVYVTGILANSLQIKLYNLHKYFTSYPEFLQCCIDGIAKNLDCDILIGPNGGDNNLFFTFNQAMRMCRLKICQVRTKPINETCVTERKINLQRGKGIIENYQLH